MRHFFKNKLFVKRDYETSNIVACIAETAPPSPDGRWQPAQSEDLYGLTPIYTERGVEFWGDDQEIRHRQRRKNHRRRLRSHC